MKTIIIIITTMLLSSGNLKAQKWISYNTTNSNIPDNGVTDIAIDAQGNKWVATFLGIAKFNGTTFTVYDRHNSGLASNLCTAILIDKAGNVWVATHNGAYRFNPTTNVWTTFLPNSGIARSTVLSMAMDSKGNIWFGHDMSMISKFDGTNWTLSAMSWGHYNVNSIAIDQTNDNVWFTLYGEGLYKIVGNTTYTAVGYMDVYIISICLDNAHGTAWFGAETGVSSLSGTTWTHYSTFEYPVGGSVHAILVDAQNNKWFGTNNALTKFDGTTWTNFTTTNSGIPGNGVGCIVKDAGGIMWLTNYGLVRFNPNATGTDEIKAGNNIEMYPNPATEKLSVNGINPNSTISIYNLNGQLVLSQELNGSEIDISQLVNGIYTAKITDNTGVYTQKLVKQ
ncbi:MAG: two-component regulator propeller domain-containing protein [Bacteroidota bacterium]|nr:two-component regulator propeller domain-containing protein [Bacteroidota bacterium]